MNRDKQIEEMANDLASHCPDLVENCCGAMSCVSCLTNYLHNAGYRKSGGVAREIFEEIEPILLDYQNNFVSGLQLITFIKELKKKYTEDVE